MNTEQKIEALLFYKGEPMTQKELSKVLSVSEDQISQSLESLRENLKGRGIELLSVNDKVELRTAAEVGEIIEKLRKEELSRDLGKAGSETLSIVLYKGPVTRSEIDFIRGVNSTFILRNLLIRGLVERIPNPTDQRSYLYQGSMELLAHLGVTKVEELPEYEQVQLDLKQFEKEAEDLESREKPEETIES